MMSIKCIAIDDEPAALEVIRLHCDEVSFIQIERTFLNPIKALDYLQKEVVDLVFLDINMPQLTGFQLWSILPVKPLVILTTAYSEYAAKGFDFEAVDYLLKPIPFDRFLKACLKVGKLKADKEQITQVLHQSCESTFKDHLFVKIDANHVRINFADLLYVMSDGNYVQFFTNDGNKKMGRYTLNEVEQLLPSMRFIRIHRRYIVNESYVESTDRDNVVVNGILLPLGTNFRKEFLIRIGAR